MIPGMNSKQLKQAMKRMGVQQQEIEATEVIIRTPEKEIIFENPSVSKVNMMGQDTYQIVGEETERPIDNLPSIEEGDIETVMNQTGADKETAKKAIENNDGDLASAIMELKN